jgi:hypothetical protein
VDLSAPLDAETIAEIGSALPARRSVAYVAGPFICDLPGRTDEGVVPGRDQV